MRRVFLGALGLALMLAPTALPHHSNVAFEVTKIITLKGVVKDLRWSNPHTWIVLTVDDGKGGKADWAIEGRAPGVLSRAGWTKTTVKPGDTITVDFSPAKDGTKTGLVARVTQADGTVLENAPPPTE
jgi:Family of unknown function (DUF6152)